MDLFRGRTWVLCDGEFIERGKGSGGTDSATSLKGTHADLGGEFSCLGKRGVLGHSRLAGCETFLVPGLLEYFLYGGVRKV